MDVRPLISFMAGLPGATAEFCDMARRLEKPDSFYDKMLNKCKMLNQLYMEIVEMDDKCKKIAEIIEASETSQKLEENCSVYLQSASNDLENNEEVRKAVAFLRSKLH